MVVTGLRAASLEVWLGRARVDFQRSLRFVKAHPACDVVGGQERAPVDILQSWGGLPQVQGETPLVLVAAVADPCPTDYSRRCGVELVVLGDQSVAPEIPVAAFGEAG